jgi:hypothetical protein
MDADLQDDPEILPEMVRLCQGGADIVFGVRQDRSSDSTAKRRTAHAYYSILKAMGVKVVHDHADYRVLSRRALMIFTKAV